VREGERQTVPVREGDEERASESEMARQCGRVRGRESENLRERVREGERESKRERGGKRERARTRASKRVSERAREQGRASEHSCTRASETLSFALMHESLELAQTRPNLL